MQAVRHEERRIESARLALVQESEALQAERQSCQRERQQLKEQAVLLADDREEHAKTQRVRFPSRLLTPFSRG